MEAAPINKKLLKWAREEANLSLEDAALRAGIKGLKPKKDFLGLTPTQRLKKWEEGQELPTLRQLEQVAKAYRRPVLTFFLKDPPRKEFRLKDFRTIGRKTQVLDSPEFAAFLRKATALHKAVKSIVRQEGGGPLRFVGSASDKEPPSRLVDKIRTALQFPLLEQLDIKDSKGILSKIRDRAQKIGIFIVLRGNLGSYHTDIEPEVFRGLVISDEFAPFIFINPKDAKAAQLFTIVHELAHLWLGDSGITNKNALEINNTNSAQDREIYCEQVAADFLLPEKVFLDAYKNEHGDDDKLTIELLSKVFKVSRIAVARRLLNYGLVSRDFYWDYYGHCQAEWEKIKAFLKEKDGGPGYITQTKYKLGEKLISTVVSAAYTGRISELDASQILDVKINHFESIYPGG